MGRVVLLGLFAIVLSSCMVDPPPEFKPAKYTSTAADKEWIPSPDRVSGQPLERQLKAEAPPEIGYDGEKTLSELVDIALQNNPKTRFAWAAAHADAAAWAAARGAYYPQIDADAAAGYRKTALMPRGRYLEGDIMASYQILDLGGRGAQVEAARQAMVAANYNHNQVIQDVFRDVTQNYHKHLASKARVKATEQSLREALTSLEATRVRKEVGVDTLADVLQAQSNADQIKFDLVKNKGDVSITAGDMAVSVGWPSDTPIKVMGELRNLPMKKIDKNVDELITESKKSRPDIAKSLAELRQREAGVIKARSDLFPTLNAAASYLWDRDRLDTKTYEAGLKLNIPIFHGFTLRNKLRKAKAELEAARQQFKEMELGVISEVWNSFFYFRTARDQFKASKTLLASASESYKVSLGRYRAGAADIVELLNAQSLLAEARSEHVDAQMNVYITFADLLHAVGRGLPKNYFDAGPSVEQNRKLMKWER